MHQSKISCTFRKTVLDKLKQLVAVCETNINIFPMSKLNSFKKYIKSLKDKITGKMSGDASSSQPKEVPPDVESALESNVKLDTKACLKPDPINRNKKIGDASEVTKENYKKSENKCIEAIEQFSKKHFDKAIELFTEAIELNPYSTFLLVNRSQVHLKSNNLDACIRDCTKALELNPNSVGAFRIRGRAHRLKEEWEDAVRDFCQAFCINFEKKIDKWITEATQNARTEQNLEQEKRWLEKEERGIPERRRKVRKSRSKVRAAHKSHSRSASKTDNLYRLFHDLEVTPAFADRDDSTSFTNILSNSNNFYERQSNPKLMSQLTKEKSAETENFPKLQDAGFSKFEKTPKSKRALPLFQKLIHEELD